MTTPASLGRRPSPPDSRDYNLRDFLPKEGEVVAAPTQTPLQEALEDVLADRGANKSVKDWIALATPLIGGVTPNPQPPVPPAPPAPALVDKVWSTPIVLDQGQTRHCVGFGWADWANAEPIYDHLTDADGNAIYYECKVIDGEPGMEDGSDVRSGAKAMLARKRLSAYAFAQTLADAEVFIKAKGVVVVGTDWMNDMFNPDANGYVVPTGGVAGGHCYLWTGVLDSEDAYEFENSWGSTWGLGGKFKMKKADFAALFVTNGEACASVELPL